MKTTSAENTIDYGWFRTHLLDDILPDGYRVPLRTTGCLYLTLAEDGTGWRKSTGPPFPKLGYYIISRKGMN